MPGNILVASARCLRLLAVCYQYRGFLGHLHNKQLQPPFQPKAGSSRLKQWRGTSVSHPLPLTSRLPEAQLSLLLPPRTQLLPCSLSSSLPTIIALLALLMILKLSGLGWGGEWFACSLFFVLFCVLTNFFSGLWWITQSIFSSFLLPAAINSLSICSYQGTLNFDNKLLNFGIKSNCIIQYQI